MSHYNVDVKKTNMKVFCDQDMLKTLNEEPTCLRNVNNPSCIGLFLKNSSKCVFGKMLNFREVCQICISS